jgi:hypothetical protein
MDTLVDKVLAAAAEPSPIGSDRRTVEIVGKYQPPAFLDFLPMGPIDDSEKPQTGQ